MMFLTNEQYKHKVEALKKAAKKVGYTLEIHVSEDYINRRSSLWHGGLVATLSKNNILIPHGHEIVEEPLEINIDAIGDVCLEIDGEMFKDKANTGRMCGELTSAGYKNDDELLEAIDKDKIYIDANNWYEISGNYCGCFVDLECVSDYDDYLETIQEVIDNIENFEQDIKDLN